MSSSLTSRRWLVVLSVLAAIGVIAAVIGVTDYAATRAFGRYDHERQHLSADLRAAQLEGYTKQDLVPVTEPFQSLQAQPEPALPIARAQLDDQRAARVASLDAQLKTLLRQVLDKAQTDTATQLASARSGIDHNRSVGTDEADLTALQQRLDKVTQVQGAAHSLSEYRGAGQQAQVLVSDVNSVAAAQEAQNQAVMQAAEQLKGQNAGNLDAVRKAGTDAVAGGRNDTSVAAYMNKSAPFNGFDALNRLYARLEKYGQMIGSADPGQSALGAAGAQLIAAQIHGGLTGGLPAKAIVISYSSQHLWAYEHGKLVQETPVTTGRPALPTDLGPMKVLKKDSPWKMHSPWPKGSPYWYPDTAVKMVVWFTNTGEGLHDADWQRCCWGPGSQYTGNASHGCIHLPDGAESFIYRWSEIGIPVVVYEGDGSTVNQQLSKITTDDRGNPFSGPKGV
jgi:lipoprotein-anchoring transpeptidase ErfK/SrfK